MYAPLADLLSEYSLYALDQSIQRWMLVASPKTSQSDKLTPA